VNRLVGLIGLGLVWLWLMGCGLGQAIATMTPAPVPLPTVTTEPIAAAPTSTPLPLDTGWLTLRPGLEQRTINLSDPLTGQRRESITLVRLDPPFFNFNIAYHPGEPQDLTAWQAETGALLVVNGGYFTPEYLATGLIIADGQASGVSYEGFGGMVVIQDGGLMVRSLVDHPYDGTEPIAAALQSFPLLVKPGGLPGFPEEDNLTSRRTVIAQDRQGRILFLVAPLGHFSLYRLSQWLVDSDLELDIALNLDGGTSTSLLLADPPLHIASFDLLPVVITAMGR
jgi:uncharacterized protein YigE (DUF2233 family)